MGCLGAIFWLISCLWLLKRRLDEFFDLRPRPCFLELVRPILVPLLQLFQLLLPLELRLLLQMLAVLLEELVLDLGLQLSGRDQVVSGAEAANGQA